MQSRHSFVLRIQTNRRTPFGPKVSLATSCSWSASFFLPAFSKERISSARSSGYPARVPLLRGNIPPLRRRHWSAAQAAKIEWIVVFAGIQLDRAAKIVLCRSRLALPRPRDRQIIQNLRQVRSGDHEGLLQRNEHFLREVGLAKQKPANARCEDRFHIAIVSFWHPSVPGERGIAVAPREIGFASAKSGSAIPVRGALLPAVRANALHLRSPATRDCSVQRIKTQRTLAFRELGEIQRIVAIARGEHPPNQPGVQVHKRIQRAGFPQAGSNRAGLNFKIRDSMVSDVPFTVNLPITTKSASRSLQYEAWSHG